MATYLTASHWLIGLPNELGSIRATVDRVRAGIEQRGSTAEVSSWDVPIMKVGTLDSLLTLADDLSRGDTFAETVVRKVERQVADSYIATKASEAAKGSGARNVNDGDSASTSVSAVNLPPLELRVSGVPVAEYIRKFTWDAEQYDSKEPLPDLLRRLTSAAERVDADVRVYASAYAERKSALTATERRRTGNLLVCGLEEIITPAALDACGAEFVPADSEFLQTMVLVLPKTAETTFLGCYEWLDNEAVPMGTDPNNREAVRGSPVVPRSARRVTEDKDGYVLYTVTILRKFVDSFKAACREKRFTVRDFSYDPNAARSAATSAANLEVEVATTLAALRDAAGRKYSEAMAVWLHVKAVRMFVECVLRFGLPVNFCAVLVRLPKHGSGGSGNARKVVEGVQAAWHSISSGLVASGALSASASTTTRSSILDDMYGVENAKSAASSSAMGSIAGITDSTSSLASFPFVLLDFDVRNDTGQSGGSGGPAR